MVMILVIILLIFEFGSDIDTAAPPKKMSAISDFKSTPKADLKDTRTSSTSWCDQIDAARRGLDKKLQISYPCEKMQPATSAVVCMLTAGVSDDKQANRVVFTARNYIEGAMALGQTVRENIDTSQTHMLLLVREGFMLAPDDATRLEAVGWTIGTAPDFDLPQKYVPRFPRYKTTYTKVTAIGLAEYKCAMLMDADALVVGDVKELMTCKIFTQPQHRVAGTLDYFRKSWYFFNTGSILWRTSVEEMNRVFQLSRDDTFMKRFSSDQEFLNNVYPDRMNKNINNDIVAGNLEEADKGGVVTLPWDYNAQTHAEVEFTDYWREHRSTVKILHFTEKKGWQCEESHTEPIPWEQMPDPCKKEISVCYCRDAHLYWNALRDAKELGDRAIQEREKRR
jgi:predicted Rossmann-fold nucleotide-binding protein